ncbi:glycoside hydrolase family 13 [Saccharothrix sp. NPDC042600]|uniref:glycoside hydrolase family 13 n=1 Tax=Saccharothrix TaxID=2071 RepID=UPI0033F21C63|nr:isoamylase [Saccharothrix mutabilis subsp. capreolus]
MLRSTHLFGPKRRVTFSLPVDDPDGPVSVVGSFNDWTPGIHELVPRRDGTRTVTVILPPGTHRFRYLGPDGHWFDDDHAQRLDGDSAITI